VHDDTPNSHSGTSIGQLFEAIPNSEISSSSRGLSEGSTGEEKPSCLKADKNGSKRLLVSS
jgi:hypothetical protein